MNFLTFPFFPLGAQVVFAHIYIFPIDIMLTEFSNEHESCDYYVEVLLETAGLCVLV